MRNCKNCNEELEDNFEICWKCGSENELINNEGNKVDFEIPNVNTQDSLSFAFSPREYDNSTSKENFSAINSQNTNKKKNKIFIITIIVIVFVSYMSSLDKKSPANSSNHNTQNIQNNQPCSDMESYNQGLSEGRTQKGILTDCDTYYPYAGWATNKECWCEGFNKGKNE